MHAPAGRFWLTLLIVSAGCATATTPGAAPRDVTEGLVIVSPTEPREQTADQQVQQVLNRLAFGPRPGEAAAVRAMGVDRWIALQLAPERISDTAATRVLASYEMLDRPTPELMQMYRDGQVTLRRLQKEAPAMMSPDSMSKPDRRAEVLRQHPELREQVRENQRVLGDVQSAKLARAVVSDRQLVEVMTDFWENHFTVFAGKGFERFLIPAYDRDVIRPRALGKFRDLLGAVAKSPAMLFFLDQWQSAADSAHPTLAALPRRFARRPQARTRGLNENYARELLELHTLGVDGGYTQQDVIEVARALTGWTMAPQQGAEFVFRPQIHDAGPKVVLGHHLRAGRGIEDGEEVLDIVARDPHTAHFIAKKLAIRFVSDDPPPALVERAARTFQQTDGDIREVVRTIVTSPEFFSRAVYRAKVKSPFELVASAVRAIGGDADSTLRSAQAVARLGQPVFGHQAPNGWPETGDAWMNTGAILNRINFGLALAGGQLPSANIAHWPASAALRSAPRATQVDAVVDALLGGNVSPDTRQILLSGENPMVARLGASVPDDTTMLPVRAAGRGQQPLTGLPQVVGLALGAPEFQRR